MAWREPSTNSRRLAAIVVVVGTLPTSGRIIRSTVRLRSQPTSLALRMVSPRRCRRQVENEWPNMKRTKMLVTMQPASTTAVTSTLRVISSTRKDIVSGPPTIATPSVAIPVSMLTVESSGMLKPDSAMTAAKNFPRRLPTNSEQKNKPPRKPDASETRQAISFSAITVAMKPIAMLRWRSSTIAP